MTVGELRAVLADVPDNAIVIVYDSSGDAVEAAGADAVHIADDGTGIYAVRDNQRSLERWAKKHHLPVEIGRGVLLFSDDQDSGRSS